ncbi:hypothetical protein [Nitratifractor sp.]
MKRNSQGLSLTLILGFAGLFLLSGCAPKVPQLPAQPKETNATLWHSHSSVEENYHLKPEPYSLDSNQKDPELLGPQSTLKQPLESEIQQGRVQEETQSDAQPFLENGVQINRNKPSASEGGMTRSRCIALIGKSKYEQYTKQFGSEEAALRKCTILERVQRQ